MLLHIQKGAAEYPLPLGGVSQFSLEDIFTAPSTPNNRRRRVAFRKRVFDRDMCLPEYDPKPELLTKDYKTRPGPRARVSLSVQCCILELPVHIHVCVCVQAIISHFRTKQAEMHF